MCSSVSPRAERFRGSFSGLIITFHDRRQFSRGIEARRVRRNERQFYLDCVGKSPNAMAMV